MRSQSKGSAQQRRIIAHSDTGAIQVDRAQEALQNALRHAAATHVLIRLETSPESVRLTVQDDGRGLPEGDAATSRFGLVGMRERARLLGGSFQVESAPGAGTRITAEVPLRRS